MIMNITITGNLGSGKTSICKVLQEKGYEVISAGSIFREVAVEKGVSVIELNEMCKKDPNLDYEIDARSERLGKEKDGVIFDSRMAWNFVDDSFKVFILVNVSEATRRVYSGVQRNAESYDSMEQAAEMLRDRAELERRRFKDLYHVDYYDARNYNLIIESTNASPAQLAEEIIRNFELYQEGKFQNKIELNPVSLYPTKRVCDMDKEKLESCLEIEKKNTMLCSEQTASVIMKNGCFFLTHAHHHSIMAAHAGKAFIAVKVEEPVDDVTIPDKETCNEYEKLGNITYPFYPEDVADMEHYMFDFTSKV